MQVSGHIGIQEGSNERGGGMGGENRKVGWWFHYFYSICSTYWSLGLYYLDNHNNICESIGNYKSFLPSPRAILHPPSKFASITKEYSTEYINNIFCVMLTTEKGSGKRPNQL